MLDNYQNVSGLAQYIVRPLLGYSSMTIPKSTAKSYFLLIVYVDCVLVAALPHTSSSSGTQTESL